MFFERRNEKRLMEFVTLISKMEPQEYCGVCKILGVKLFNEEKEPRAFEETLSELIDKFLKMKKKPRRELMKVLKVAGK